MLKRLLLAVALVFGALALTQAPSQAMPLGASSAAETATPAQVQQAQYYYYGRPRRYYRPYYRPRYYGYYGRPRYYGYRPYYRPRPRFYFGF